MQWTWIWPWDSKGWRNLVCWQSMGLQRVGYELSNEQQQQQQKEDNCWIIGKHNKLKSYYLWYKYLYCKTQIMLLLLFSWEVVSHPFITPWTIACQASLHGISQGRMWNGLPFPCLGTFPTKGLNTILHWQEDSYH